MRRAFRAAGLAVLLAVATACGGSPAEDAGGSHANGHGADGAEMNMGDPDAVPADEVPGAEVVRGDFQLLDTAPQGYQDVAGTAVLARHGGGTTVTVELSGLEPGVELMSHVHDGSCAEGGGAHYEFDPNGGGMPPNEIHLAFTSTPEGTGYMTAENERVAGPRARSVVVHPREFQDNRVACAPLS